MAAASIDNTLMSAISVSGFDGVSRNSMRVAGRIAASQAAVSVRGTKVVSIPNLASQVENNMVVVPKMLCEETT